MKITLKGVPVKLTGTLPTINESAPDFSIQTVDGETITKDSLKGKVVLISTFPDIDTRICDMQTRKFFERASEIEDVTIINLSNNDPKALTSWCATNGIESLMAIDTDQSFAQDYGIWVNLIKHLARGVFIIDKEGILRYVELVKELSSEPDYDSAIEAAQAI